MSSNCLVCEKGPVNGIYVYDGYHYYCRPCRGCDLSNAKLTNEGKCVLSNGYHAECLPCRNCGLAIINGAYVDNRTGYHARCLPCRICNRSVVNGYYVNSTTHKHYFC